MRQYASQSQSGTMMSSQRGKEQIDLVVDRVMAIAQRVVGAENVIKNQSRQIDDLNKQVKDLIAQNEKLTTKIENIALKASGQEFKKPTTSRKTSKAKAEPEPVVDSILDEGEEVK